MIYDVIVIGGGVSGLNCALYALRNGKSVLIFEGDAVGGQIANSPKVENFPTFMEISGSDLADKFYEQVQNRGAEFEYDRVISVEKQGNIFTVSTEYDSYQAKSVVAAVGVAHKHIGVSGETELLGNGVYYCALCDGPFYKGREVALIGDGNTAMQYSILLSSICLKVYLLTWTDKFFGDKELEKTLRSKENVVFMPHTQTVGFCGENSLTAVEYLDKQTGETKKLEVPAVFVAIGQVPNNKIFENLAELDANGYFIAGEDMSTKTPGFFVAGDCRAKGVRQLTTAISDGAIAAISACAYIEKQTY
ncbi:MAG: FAD-dependent oxidoreductase [Clostridia bacterium]|nr:FAD-dependent oxidoreductase [Clostridia bacterium]